MILKSTWNNILWKVQSLTMLLQTQLGNLLHPSKRNPKTDGFSKLGTPEALTTLAIGVQPPHWLVTICVSSWCTQYGKSAVRGPGFPPDSGAANFRNHVKRGAYLWCARIDVTTLLTAWNTHLGLKLWVCKKYSANICGCLRACIVSSTLGLQQGIEYWPLIQTRGRYHPVWSTLKIHYIIAIILKEWDLRLHAVGMPVPELMNPWQIFGVLTILSFIPNIQRNWYLCWNTRQETGPMGMNLKTTKTVILMTETLQYQSFKLIWWKILHGKEPLREKIGDRGD